MPMSACDGSPALDSPREFGDGVGSGTTGVHACWLSNRCIALDQRVDPFRRKRVVQAGPHSAHAAMPLQAVKPLRLGELENWLSRSSPQVTKVTFISERLSRSAVGLEEPARVECRVQFVRLGAVASLHRRQAALRLDPLHHQAHHVNAERGARVVHRFVVGVRAVLQHRRQIFSAPRSTRSLRMMTSVTPDGPRFFWAPA